MNINRNCCKFCNKQLATRQSKFIHEKNCKEMKRSNSGNNLKTAFAVEVDLTEKKSSDIDRFSFYFLYCYDFL